MEAALVECESLLGGKLAAEFTAANSLDLALYERGADMLDRTLRGLPRHALPWEVLRSAVRHPAKFAYEPASRQNGVLAVDDVTESDVFRYAPSSSCGNRWCGLRQQ